jgi:hypothetical protein
MASEQREPAASAKSGRPAATIRFDAEVMATRGGRAILRLPEPASKALPSRGQVAVCGTLNGQPLETVIEPDGDFGHWMNVDPGLSEAGGAGPGDTATVEVQPTKEWPEPTVPDDLRAALGEAAPEVRALWEAITPMARWEWVRWVNETKNPDTRMRRVEVSISKLSSGKRRPCCFNLASCTDPDLAKSGKLALG